MKSETELLMKAILLLLMLASIAGCASTAVYELGPPVKEAPRITMSDHRAAEQRTWHMEGFPSPIAYLGDANTEPTKLELLAYNTERMLSPERDNIDIAIDEFQLIDVPAKSAALMSSASLASVSPLLASLTDSQNDLENVIICQLNASLNGEYHSISTSKSYNESGFHFFKYNDPAVIAAIYETLKSCTTEWASHFSDESATQ